MTRSAKFLGATVAAVSLLGGAGCTLHDFDKPLTLGGAVVQADTLNRGKEHYNNYCRQCHGENGDGKGTSATGLRPPPRDFSQGLFKFGGVAAPALPPDSELKRIVRGGLHGTAMLPWDLPDGELDPILQYIKTFSPKWQQPDPGVGKPIEVSQDPFAGAREKEGIELGKKLYHAKAQCSGCHPAYVTHEELFNITKAMTGQEMTAFSADMYNPQPKESEYCLTWKPVEPAKGQTRDKWIDSRECALPVRVLPPDFTRTPIRNVRIPRFQSPAINGRAEVKEETSVTDLYRTIAAGIGGANMPTWKGSLTEDELWGLVHYVKSLIDVSQDAKGADTMRAALLAPANMNWAPPKAPEPVAPAPGAPGTTPPPASPTGTAPAGGTGAVPQPGTAPHAAAPQNPHK